MDLFTEFTKDNPSFGDIRDIRSFQKIIRFTKIASLENSDIKNAIADLIVKELVQHLKATNLFGFASIEVTTESVVHVAYLDDVYHFAILVSEDSFMFARKGSTIEEFLKTMEVFMPFFTSIYNDVVAYIQGAMPNIGFVPHMCGYRFEIKLEDFHSAIKMKKDRLANYELMERLVPSIEKAESPVSKVSFATRGRTDLKLSGTLDLDDILWLGWIGIEAPGNQNYSTLELVFELQSTTLEELHGKREPFNPQSIDSWKTPFIPFLRDKIFCGFLEDWLGDVRVKSVR